MKKNFNDKEACFRHAANSKRPIVGIYQVTSPQGKTHWILSTEYLTVQYFSIKKGTTFSMLGTMKNAVFTSSEKGAMTKW